jgi:hypothetical protein
LDLEAQGEHVEQLDKKPELYTDLYSDYNAFLFLSASRTSGFGPSAIAISEIYAYMQMFEIDDYQQRRRFLNHIKILDSVYLDYMDKKEK